MGIETRSSGDGIEWRGAASGDALIQIGIRGGGERGWGSGRRGLGFPPGGGYGGGSGAPAGPAQLAQCPAGPKPSKGGRAFPFTFFWFCFVFLYCFIIFIFCFILDTHYF